MDRGSQAQPSGNAPVPLKGLKLRHICEVCGKEEWLTPEEAFLSGWDYPPQMYQFGVISPRTCPHCPIDKTVWWELAVNGKKLEDLSPAQKAVVERIMAEPTSILPPTRRKN